MKVAFLPIEENKKLLQELKTEYVKIDYACFVNDLLFKLNNRDPNLTMVLCNELVFIINKIFLDNIFRHVANKTYYDLIRLVNNNFFSKDIYINPFYLSQITEHLNINPLDIDEVSNMIKDELMRYIDRIYFNNLNNLNMNIICTFELMHNSFGHLNFSIFKFELMNYCQPMLIYEEATYETSLSDGG